MNEWVNVCLGTIVNSGSILTVVCSSVRSSLAGCQSAAGGGAAAAYGNAYCSTSQMNVLITARAEEKRLDSPPQPVIARARAAPSPPMKICKTTIKILARCLRGPAPPPLRQWRGSPLPVGAHWLSALFKGQFKPEHRSRMSSYRLYFSLTIYLWTCFNVHARSYLQTSNVPHCKVTTASRHTSPTSLFYLFTNNQPTYNFSTSDHLLIVCCVVASTVYSYLFVLCSTVQLLLSAQVYFVLCLG